MDELEWWKKRVHALAGKRREVEQRYLETKKQFPEAEVYRKKPWAFDKLVLLSYYIDIYSNIIKNQEWVDNMVYIDLFSGPGFNIIEGYDEVVPGSPLLAQLMPKKGKEFDSLVLFETDKTRADTLRVLLPNASVHNLDSNSMEAKKVMMNELDKPRTHFLAFIDPEGTECHWSTVEFLLRRWGDLIINCQHNSAARNVGTYRGRCDERTKDAIEKRLFDYFGSNAWMSIEGNFEGDLESKLKGLYKDKLKLYRNTIVETSTGQETGGYKYSILVATKLTTGGSPWLKSIEDARDRIHRTQHSELEKWIQFYRGKRDTVEIQRSLDEYW
ncbi:MAG: three-Cys-motif partner protein TcmP [Candidatus Thorarchaeota archaeon]